MIGYMAKGVEVADCIRIVNQLTLKLEEKPRLPRWVQCNHKSPSSRRGKQKRVREMGLQKILRDEARCCWLWRQKEGNMNQGMRAASRSRKRQRNGYSPSASGREFSPTDTLISALLDFYRWWIHVIISHESVVNLLQQQRENERKGPLWSDPCSPLLLYCSPLFLTVIFNRCILIHGSTTSHSHGSIKVWPVYKMQFC